MINSCFTRITACLTLVGVTSCAEQQPGSGAPRLTRLEQELTVDHETFGSAEGRGTLSMVLAARMAPGGNRVLVLDNVAPYLKTFDRDGSLVEAIVGEGEGPGEMRFAGTLAVDDRRAVLVGPGAVQVVDLSGHHRFKAAPSFRLLDVGFDCGGRLLGYGPTGVGSSPLVHVLHADTALEVLQSSVEGDPPQLAWGYGRSALLGGADGSIIAHRRVDGIQLLFFHCSGELQERSWSWAPATFPSQLQSAVGPEEENAQGVRMTVDPTSPMFQGAGELPGALLLWLESRMVPTRTHPRSMTDYEPRTYIYSADSSGVYSGYVVGDYTLQDISGREVLLSSSEPWPRVLVVDATTLLETLRDGEWRARPGL